ncbi:MAG: AbrB/MazE/SpoVT family DNA-binding domain-containing protein [Solirubrobacterales bacterium]|nr:AbrB/MazE/SpoVT family DNA-binding domain-containing protein [Solirubrobacterales bacterium]
MLPAGLRRELGLKPGSRFAIDTEADGTVRLRPYAAIARASMGILADIAPPDVSLVDELIAERRREAKREEERFKPFTESE